MIPKFRAWDKENERMHEVVSMWLDNSPMIVVRNGETVDTIFDNFELMQSTGLKDRNGFDIFEGDLLRDNLFEEYGKVEIDEGRFVCVTETNCTDLFEVSSTFEINGNIYENTELLEVKG